MESSCRFENMKLTNSKGKRPPNEVQAEEISVLCHYVSFLWLEIPISFSFKILMQILNEAENKLVKNITVEESANRVLYIS